MINQEEYEILKSLDNMLKWISRDKDSDIFTFEEKPYKRGGEWVTAALWKDGSDFGHDYVDEVNLFQFIQWEDEEPYNIAELIEEYEYSALERHVNSFKELSKAIRTKESEDTEVKKNKEWAQKEVDRYLSYEGVNEARNALVFAKGVIDQLEEPEVLSQEWIDEYAQGDYDEWVYTEDLENFLVPKQELPVIPKYVADWIEGNKQSEEKWSDYDKEDAMNDTIHFTIYGLFADYPATNSHVELRKPVLKWLSVDRGNYFKLVNAVRYGYEVEEEPLYRARLKVITDKFIASYLRTQSSDAKYRLKALEIGSKYTHEDHRHLSEFTENELKRLGIWGSEQWEVEEVE